MKKDENGSKKRRFSLFNAIKQSWQHWRRPLTIMLAPHDEGKVLSFRVSILSLWVFGFLFVGLFFFVILFSTSNYQLTQKIDNQDASILKIMDESQKLWQAVGPLPAITEVLEGTISTIDRDFGHTALAHLSEQGGDLEGGTVSSRGAQSAQDLGIQKIEDSIRTIEDTIPLIATLGELLDTQKQFLSEIPTAWPVISRRGTITMLFGPGRDPFTDGWQFHTGVDIAHSVGTPVVAAADGVVVRTSYNAGGYGNIVYVRHNYGFYTRYAHMQRYTVVEGQRVKQGEQLGLMGATGRATGSHVHFEVLLGTEARDPMQYLSIIDSSLVGYIRIRN
ncbi:M23 family metallopeptidase [Entomospira culicis]|uniref:M23 family metallopeptidase n=1 Tax=Entomospira culicis TaxID=2719989 RepID=A0A968GFI4_9SPIO|nr:M23 family metallopeptidase [Entomospira culicis]NIZ18666.1 M23 family metallopeptidase [Entomospira culicis]NIZ68881.1 M23 family metallopeptidase [Entomospira culicis]WDI37474.1 M23 family metallopeptidase [Entomospira culicis]WDI39102.1 M23 family metallopeptidase [Entomospira culicis]